MQHFAAPKLSCIKLMAIPAAAKVGEESVVAVVSVSFAAFARGRPAPALLPAAVVVSVPRSPLLLSVFWNEA